MVVITALSVFFAINSPCQMWRLKTAGVPAYSTFSGTSESTTLFAAITLLLPILTSGRTTTPAPNQTLSPIFIGA